MPTLCSLPPELRIEILSQLPDLRSLAAAIFTSRAIYEAFTIAQDDVMERVLNAEIALASIIVEVDLLLGQDCAAALRDRSSDVRSEVLDMLCVNQALVSSWCRRFCEDSLPELASGDHSPPSPPERRRIQRAFYRFWALSRASAASGRKYPTLSDHLSFAKTYMLRYSLWEVVELALICRYIDQKLDRLCFLHASLVTEESRFSCSLRFYDPEYVRKLFLSYRANQDIVASLARLDLPTLHSLLFSPQTISTIFGAFIYKTTSCHRIWSSLLTADRKNRKHDPTAFPPRCICTRRDMPSDEYNENLRGAAKRVSKLPAAAFHGGEVHYDLALWDDSRLERLGLFLPVVEVQPPTPRSATPDELRPHVFNDTASRVESDSNGDRRQPIWGTVLLEDLHDGNHSLHWPETPCEETVLQWFFDYIDPVVAPAPGPIECETTYVPSGDLILENCNPKRKCDLLVCSRVPGSQGRTRWDQVRVVGKLNADPEHDAPDKTFIQLGNYVREIFGTHPEELGRGVYPVRRRHAGIALGPLRGHGINGD
ncbi:hypothetical protein FN846DRAFT_1013219 [Sphaerosporella brunnea]|uniref:F-box domain-containing protein n=1 Tax=Sphaerosporella brunnea TaxID=1250544 RepID=A0A5J5EYZ9_9PEZI|nr:hypothetical protein FN846DRAFT_1013219 [Sphaerosporella brunnea]